MKSKFTICILIILLQFSIYPQFPYESSNTTLLGRVASGRCLTNKSVGNYTYIGNGGIFEVLYTLDPYNPTFLDSVVTPGIIQKIFIDSTFAYVADGIGGLRIIDVSNPDSISELGSYNSPGNTYSVAVSGNYAYLADGSGGFRVVDVSDPYNPINQSQAHIPFSGASDITLKGNVAYLAASGQGLQTINISDPLNPSSLGSYTSNKQALGVDVNVNYAFIADEGGMRVIDITNPESLSIIDSFATTDVARKVTVVGDSAYVAASNAGLIIIDISNVSTLTKAGYYDSPGKAFDVSINNDVAYLSDAGHGLRIVDLTTTNPTTQAIEITYYDTPSYNYGIDVQENYAYIAGTGKGLRIIDISNISNPIEVGHYYANGDVNKPPITPTYFYSVKAVGDYVYAANSIHGLMVLDVSNKNNPTVAGEIDTQGESLDIAVDSNYAYLADKSGGLYIMNIDTPSNPYQTGRYSLITSAEGIAVQGSFAYVADGLSGLYMIDISNKSKPREVNHRVTPGEAVKVAVSGKYAYVADALSGLQIIDISDTVNLPIVGSYNTSDQAKGIALNLPLVYVADGGYGVKIIDVSDLESTSKKGHFITASQPANVFAYGDTIFVADTDDEMMIIKNDFATPVELASFSAKYSEGAVALNWKTATELNNYGFQIERKKENGNWGTLGFVKGNGNSNSTKKYSYVDKELSGSSKWYYRLKQIDNDGSFKFSNIVDVNVSPSIFSLSQNYPNPFNPSTKIKYTLPVASHVKLIIYDILGNQVKTLVDKNQEQGFYEAQFDGKDMSSGVYIYQLKTDQSVSTKKMILIK